MQTVWRNPPDGSEASWVEPGQASEPPDRVLGGGRRGAVHGDGEVPLAWKLPETRCVLEGGQGDGVPGGHGQ